MSSGHMKCLENFTDYLNMNKLSKICILCKIYESNCWSEKNRHTKSKSCSSLTASGLPLVAPSSWRQFLYLQMTREQFSLTRDGLDNYLLIYFKISVHFTKYLLFHCKTQIYYIRTVFDYILSNLKMHQTDNYRNCSRYLYL